MLKANLFPQLAQVDRQTIVTDEADAAEGAGSMTINLALAPVGGGAGAVITSVNVTDLTESVLRDNRPNDLRRFGLVELSR